jgi:hypothetical protein
VLDVRRESGEMMEFVCFFEPHDQIEPLAFFNWIGTTVAQKCECKMGTWEEERRERGERREKREERRDTVVDCLNA